MKIVVATPYKSADIQFILNEIQTKGHIEYQKRNIIKSINIADKKLNIKIFKIPHILNKVVYHYFRKSKAQRSFEYAQILIKKGFNTPYPIAYAERKSVLFLLDSYYLSEHIEYQLTFRTLIHDQQYPGRTQILQEFTEFTYNLQESGIYFIDHSPGNTLIDKQDNHYKFSLVDLNRMRFGHINYQKRIENFTRLSLTDEMIEIISLKYAGLCGKDYQEVYTDLYNACHTFTQKKRRLITLKRS